jgi:hypothetical protein
VFGQTWPIRVIADLRALPGGSAQLSGSALTNKFLVLLREACSISEGLFDCFRVTPYQIQYRSWDRRYFVVIQQSNDVADAVETVWQISSKTAGRNSLQFMVHGTGWKLLDEKVSPQSQADLTKLAEAGGEFLGHLVLREILPQDSLFARAVREHVQAVAQLRQGASGAAPGHEGTQQAA